MIQENKWTVLMLGIGIVGVVCLVLWVAVTHQGTRGIFHPVPFIGAIVLATIILCGGLGYIGSLIDRYLEQR